MQDSLVDKAKGWVSIPGRSKRFFFTPKLLDIVLGPHSLLDNEYRWVSA
jgi:hypothetical protein